MDKGGKQEFIIRVCCIIAAFVLWLFITSTENPVNDYKLKNVPVQLINTDALAQANLVLVPGQDFNIDLYIKGENTSILLDKKTEDFTVVADLSSYALKAGEQKIPIEIRRSPDNINIVNSDSLFIKVNLDKLVETELPVSFNISGKPKPGFYASAPKLSQKYAEVQGGARFVSLVKKLIIEEDIQDSESDIIKNYRIIPVDEEGNEVKEVSVNPSHVDVKILVRKTKTVGVKVKTIGTLDQSFVIESIKVLPERFDITGSEAELNLLENLSTEAIDLSKINKDTIIDSKIVIPTGLSLVSTTIDGSVKIEIKLTKILKKELTLNIIYNNLDTNYEVKLEKNKIALVISGSEALINSIDLNKFSATIDLVDFVEGVHTFPVKVAIPEGVNLISKDPDEILVTIIKKQTEVTNSNDN